MAHIDKRIWEYITLSRTTNPFTTAVAPGPDNRGQFFAYRAGGVQPDRLYLSRQAAGGASNEYGLVLFKGDSALLLDYSFFADGIPTIVGGVLSATRTIQAGSSNIVVTDGDGVSGNPTIDLDSSPILTDLTINGGLVVNGGVRLGGLGAAAVDPGSSAGTGATIDVASGGEYNGYFELTAGTVTATGQIAHVKFAHAFANADYTVQLQDYGGDLPVIHAYVRDQATNGFYVGARIAPVTGTTYKVGFTVLGWPS